MREPEPRLFRLCLPHQSSVSRLAGCGGRPVESPTTTCRASVEKVTLKVGALSLRRRWPMALNRRVPCLEKGCSRMRGRAHPARNPLLCARERACAGPAGLLLTVPCPSRAGSWGPGVTLRTLFAFSSGCARGCLQLCGAPRLRGMRPDRRRAVVAAGGAGRGLSGRLCVAVCRLWRLLCGLLCCQP